MPEQPTVQRDLELRVFPCGLFQGLIQAVGSTSSFRVQLTRNTRGSRRLMDARNTLATLSTLYQVSGKWQPSYPAGFRR